MSFCLSCNLSIAQVDTLHFKSNQKILVSVTYGGATPTGSITSFNRGAPAYSNPAYIIGGAKTGYNGKAEAKYFFYKNFGLQLIVSSLNNKVEAVPYEALFPFHFASGRFMTSFIYTSTNWQVTNFLAGFSSQFRQGILSLGFNFSAGYQRVKTPAIDIDEQGDWTNFTTGQSGTYTRKTSQPSVTVTNAACDLGADFRVRIIKRFGIVVSMDYLVSNPSFDSKINFSSDYEPSYAQFDDASDTHFNKIASFICYNFGVSYAIK